MQREHCATGDQASASSEKMAHRRSAQCGMKTQGLLRWICWPHWEHSHAGSSSDKQQPPRTTRPVSRLACSSGLRVGKPYKIEDTGRWPQAGQEERLRARSIRGGVVKRRPRRFAGDVSYNRFCICGVLRRRAASRNQEFIDVCWRFPTVYTEQYANIAVKLGG